MRTHLAPPTGARSGRVRALLLAVIALTVVGGGCSGAKTGPRASNMVTNEVTARGPEFSAELLRVEYLPQAVSVRVELKNRGDAPLDLALEGVLLAYDGLEYPVASDLPPGPKARLTVAPASTQVLDLTYRMGHGLAGDAHLVFRTLSRQGHWLDPISLAVPAVPVALEEPQASTGP